MYISLDRGNKPEHTKKRHTDSERMCKLHPSLLTVRREKPICLGCLFGRWDYLEKTLTSKTSKVYTEKAP